jgi:hypothetical protein
MISFRKTTTASLGAAALSVSFPFQSIAQSIVQTPPSSATTEATPAPQPPPPGYWIDGIHLSAQLESGITFNPADPKENFGQLFTDRANQPILNQLLLTANKPLDPKATGFDWGFKLQGMYGADARYTHFLGELDRAVGSASRNQLDIVEANVQFHLPVLTQGGIDLKAGQFVSPVGYETIDASTNPFYSHSYIFNFGLPFKDTGFLTTSHISPLLDVYLGMDTGVNTTFGPLGENKSAVAFVGGFGLNMMDGKLTVLALTHIGPENASRSFLTGFNVDAYYRYLNDIVVTYRATDRLSFTTEANLIRDDALGTGNSGVPKVANAFGVAQYVSYVLTDTLTLNGRAEVYRDDNNVFVLTYPGNTDFVNAEQGFPNGSRAAPLPTTFGEITLGVTYKPQVPAPITGLLVRPEVRYDRSLNNTHPYNRGTDNGQFTLASDFVLTF